MDRTDFVEMSKQSKRQSVKRVNGWPSAMPDSLLSILVDTREQNPWNFASCFGELQKRVDTVKFGDYCLEIDPHLAAVERKSLSDFVACQGRERERFRTQIGKMVGVVERPLVIVEADYSHMEIGGWRGRMTPEQVLAGLHSTLNNVPVLLCRSRGEAERACYRHLRAALKNRYSQCREFARRLQA